MNRISMQETVEQDIIEVTHPKFGRLRCFIFEGKTWFVMADVCKLLMISKEYPNNTVRFNIGAYGGKATCLEEKDATAFVLSSYRPNAKEFAAWISCISSQHQQTQKASKEKKMSGRTKTVPNFAEHYERLASNKVTKSKLCEELNISYRTLMKMIDRHKGNHSSNVKTFENQQFGKLRALTKNNESWFVAADVCKSLGHSNVSVALNRLDDDEKAKLNLGLSGGGINCINEPGLYSLVIGSRKPEAKAFKRWITHDVLPSIRKNGGYITPEKAEEILLDPDTIIRLATTLKNEKAKRQALEAQTKNLIGKMTKFTTEMNSLLSGHE